MHAPETCATTSAPRRRLRLPPDESERPPSRSDSFTSVRDARHAGMSPAKRPQEITTTLMAAKTRQSKLKSTWSGTSPGKRMELASFESHQPRDRKSGV